MTTFDLAIVGAGVTGLALARAMARRHPSFRIVVIEQAARAGTGVSSRSSEVIHAGLYYPASYLKTSLCVRGKALLYDYCASHGVPHRRTGKLVVAGSDEEHEYLHALAFRAEQNGITDLQWLDRAQLQHLEPAVQAKGAFLSPSSGIVDSAALQGALERDAADSGVTFAFRTQVLRLARRAQGFALHCDDGRTPFELAATRVVNCAGLQAVALAHSCDGMPPDTLPSLVLAKGSYFSYRGPAPFARPVYPVPATGHVAHGLGIHATPDLHGGLRFGPDFEIVEREDYAVDPHKRDVFADAIRRYFPALDADKLQAAWAGIRPRLATGSQKTADFAVHDAAAHGMPGLVHLLGIESPGLTAALALAEHVAALESLHP